jgi:hypothetical protein
MSLPLQITSFLLLLTSSLSAADWPAIILDKPFHAGDSTVSEMIVPRPQGRTFKGSFALPPQILPNVATIAYVNIEVAGLSPMNTKTLKAKTEDGTASQLQINGKTVSILNALTRNGANTVREKIQVRLAGTMLQSGMNTLEILPSRGGGGWDDIELFRVSVSSRPE